MNGYRRGGRNHYDALSTPVYSCAETQLASTHINLVQTSLTENPKTVVSTMLTTLTSEQLTTISGNMGNNNFLHKTEMLSKAVFEYDYNQAKHRLNSIAKMKEALVATTRWAFTAHFSMTNGGIN